MNRSEYQDRLGALLDQAHNLASGVHQLMSELGDDGVSTAEWHRLYDISRLASTAADMIYREKRPDTRPSALHDEAETEVAMVCTACRKPVTGDLAGTWWHTTDDAIDACPTRGNGPVQAMVAAGNESIPFDLAKPALSVRPGA